MIETLYSIILIGVLVIISLMIVIALMFATWLFIFICKNEKDIPARDENDFTQSD